MAFLPNIPQSTDQLSVSQGNILNNFSILGAIAGNSNAASASINTSIGSGLPSGFNWVYLQPQSATPPAGAAFASGNVALYSALNAATTFNELYVNKTNASGVVQIPITASSNGSISSNSAVSWSYDASGMLKIGGLATTSGGTVTITFSSTAGGGLNSFPGFASFISWITPTVLNSSASFSEGVRVKSFTLTTVTFGIINGSSDLTFFWNAFGV
jgi:hypothetical protein